MNSTLRLTLATLTLLVADAFGRAMPGPPIKLSSAVTTSKPWPGSYTHTLPETGLLRIEAEVVDPEAYTIEVDIGR